VRRYRKILRQGEAKDLSGRSFYWSKDSDIQRVLDIKNSSLSPQSRLFSRDATKTYGGEEEYGIMSRHEMHHFSDVDYISPYEHLISEESANTIVIGDL
jgi:hypothetical protein